MPPKMIIYFLCENPAYSISILGHKATTFYTLTYSIFTSPYRKAILLNYLYAFTFSSVFTLILSSATFKTRPIIDSRVGNPAVYGRGTRRSTKLILFSFYNLLPSILFSLRANVMNAMKTRD